MGVSKNRSKKGFQMSKEQELVKNTAIITFGKICTQLVSLLLLPLYTAILTTEEYGTVDLVITYSTLLLPLITLALEQGLFRFLIDIRKNEQEISKCISTTIYAVLLISALVGILLAGMYLAIGNVLIIYFAFVLYANVVSAISLQVCRGLGDNVGYTLGSSLSAIVQVLFNVLFLVVFKWGTYGMMLASALGNMVCGVVTFKRCHLNRYVHKEDFRVDNLKKMLKYSLPLIPNQLSWWALNASDKVIVQIFIGVAGNGLIAVANKFSSIYIQFSSIFNVSWTESAALYIHDDDAQTYFTTTINTVYTLFLCVCCGIIVVMPFVFPYFVNNQYNGAYGLIPIYMIASLFNVVVSLYGVIYVAHKRTVEIAYTAIYAAALNIVSHLMLFKFIGIYAAAVSTAIGYGGMAIYRYFHSRKYMCVKLKRKTIYLSIIMLATSFGAYYSSNKQIQIVEFVLVLAISLIMNRDMLRSIILIIKKRLGKNITM